MPERAPAGATTATAPQQLEVRLAGGIYALNRFLMTLQNKRMPVAGLSVSGDPKETHLTVLLDCPEETARRYATLLEGLEDVEKAEIEGRTAGHTDASAISYDRRRFRSVENSRGGEVGPETVFEYRQEGEVVRATYGGGGVRSGVLIAVADEDGRLDARYAHVNEAGELMSGECRTTPEVLSDGRLRLHEEWRWTSGDRSSGRSVVEEMGD